MISEIVGCIELPRNHNKHIKKDETQGIFLIDGANACPPEDCGGIYGYQEMLEALKQPHSKAAKEYREWLGKNFNAHKFNAKKSRKRA